MKKIFIAIVMCLSINSLTYEEEERIDMRAQESVETPMPVELEANASNMLAVCKYLGIKNPRIVTAQAILETGHFKSKVFTKYNNPFGLYDSINKRYFKFDNWIDAVAKYQMSVEYKHTGGDYYKFLEELPYATDSKYVSKVKEIESNLDKYL